MPDEIMLVRMMATIDLEFKKTMHYHNEGYGNENNYGLPSQITRPVCIYSVFTTKASFDLAEFITTQIPNLAFTNCFKIVTPLD